MSKRKTSNYIYGKEEIYSILEREGMLEDFKDKFQGKWKEDFLSFCAGKKTLPMMYDTTFKRIFDPSRHRDRLSAFISDMIGQTVYVKEVLSQEDSQIEGERTVIMDIIVALEDDSIANVEIQKSPYQFSGQRITCFSSDLILRQYSRLKGLKRNGFSYKELKKVYTIVIYEKTEKEFHEMDDYYHHGEVTFDTGLKVEMLQIYYLIALDQYQKYAYHKDESNKAGWLAFLITENLDDVERNIQLYPWLKEIYQEISTFRKNPMEVFNMYSSMIHELDVNSMQYLIDEYKDTIDAQAKELKDQAEQLADKDNQLADKDNQLADKDNQLASKDNQLAKKNQEIRDTILNLYKNGVSIELIAKSTGRSEQEVASIVS